MSAVETMYQTIILDHAKHPHRRGLRDPFDAEVWHVNPTCGDEVTLRVHLAEGAGGATVADVSYEGQGCSISQASASVLTDLVTGRSLDEARRRSAAFHALVTGRGRVEPDEDLLEDGVAFAGVARYPMRVKCALLAWAAFDDATLRAAGDATARAVTDDGPVRSAP